MKKVFSQILNQFVRQYEKEFAEGTAIPGVNERLHRETWKDMFGKYPEVKDEPARD